MLYTIERCKAHKRDHLKAVQCGLWSYMLMISCNSAYTVVTRSYSGNTLNHKDRTPFKFLQSRVRGGCTTKVLIIPKFYISNLNWYLTKRILHLHLKFVGKIIHLLILLLHTINGIEKLLSGLNPSKGAGLEHVSCRVLKELSIELVPILPPVSCSLNTRTLLSLCSQVYVAPMYKKGPQCMPEIIALFPWYVMQTVIKHILCKHIKNHLDRHRIHTYRNHGIIAKHSCETQLFRHFVSARYTSERPHVR